MDKSRWHVDDFMEQWNRKYPNDHVKEPRAFAVNPLDLVAMNETYTFDSLPPLPFPVCWFESSMDDHDTLFTFKVRDKPGDQRYLECYAMIVGGTEFDDRNGSDWSGAFECRTDVGDEVLIVFHIDKNKIVYVLPQDKDDKTYPDECPAVIPLCIELLTAHGVYKDDEIPVPRAVRRRHERAGRKAPLRAILHIGHPRSHTQSDNHKSVDWSCRWWVRGHYRHYANGKVKWIKAYVKGPEDKPWRKPPPKYLVERR